MFMHMLGYPTHFGQMETLKLVASPEFADKVCLAEESWLPLAQLFTVSLLLLSSLELVIRLTCDNLTLTFCRGLDILRSCCCWTRGKRSSCL